ncbi:MAG: phosphotransferase [Candidatus Doudnabacteria bacterium]|nr:phosphotransferase [Candidatus Doudnabacteria bacterium]
MDQKQFENLVIKKLETLYGFDVKEIKPLRGFYDFNYYVLTQQGEFFVKIFGKDKLLNIKFQIELIQFLKKKGFPVAEVVENNLKEFYFNTGRNFAFVQEWFKGRTLKEIKLTKSLLKNIGAMLAGIHIASTKKKFKFNPWKKYVWDAAQFNLVKTDFRKVSRILPKNLQTLVLKVFEDWNKNKSNLFLLPKGVSHNDFHGGNLLIKNDKIIGILDFGDALETWYSADLANALAFICFSSKKPLNLSRYLTEGYLTRRKLSTEEKKYLPLLIKMRAAALAVEIPLEMKHKDRSFYQKIYKQSIFILNYFNSNKNLQSFNTILNG